MEALRGVALNVVLVSVFGEEFVSRELAEGMGWMYDAVLREKSGDTVKRVLLQEAFWFVPEQWFGFLERQKLCERAALERGDESSEDGRARVLEGLLEGPDCGVWKRMMW